MPVCAFIPEQVHRLSRNLVCSMGILVANHSLSFSLLALVVCPWRPREKYRARAAYRKNDSIWTKINTQLVPTITHPHTKFQLSISFGSPVVVDQSFRGISGRRSRRLEGEEGPGPVGHRLAEGGEMPVCAFIQKLVNRLSRNLVCSTDILVANHSLSLNLLAQAVCPWRAFQKNRARVAY